MSATSTEEDIIAATKHWLEAAVIGLELCPFAKPVHTQDLIRYAVSSAETPEQLLADLLVELETITAADPAEIETTLLIHPEALADFLDYNDFLDAAEAAIEDLGLTGIIQIASFHPQYQFAGTEPDDIENYTNRSPYPILQLLRESSVERVVASYPETSRIFERNIETLRRLGLKGWERLGLGPGLPE
jgi:uncharacterized protein